MDVKYSKGVILIGKQDNVLKSIEDNTQTTNFVILYYIILISGYNSLSFAGIYILSFIINRTHYKCIC